MPELESRFELGNQAPTFPPIFRLYAVVLAACIALTLAWVAYIDTAWGRYFAGFLCLVIGAMTVAGVRRESGVVQNCLLAPGTVTSLHRGRRGGAHVTYSFRAFDGKEYKGASFWNVHRAELGGSIPVVYAAVDPQRNLPKSGFLFYDFKPRTPREV